MTGKIKTGGLPGSIPALSSSCALDSLIAQKDTAVNGDGDRHDTFKELQLKQEGADYAQSEVSVWRRENLVRDNFIQEIARLR